MLYVLEELDDLERSEVVPAVDVQGRHARFVSAVNEVYGSPMWIGWRNRDQSVEIAFRDADTTKQILARQTHQRSRNLFALLFLAHARRGVVQLGCSHQAVGEGRIHVCEPHPLILR